MTSQIGLQRRIRDLALAVIAALIAGEAALWIWSRVVDPKTEFSRPSGWISSLTVLVVAVAVSVATMRLVLKRTTRSVAR